MYQKFKELQSTNNVKGLSNLIENADPAELASIILPRITSNNAPSILDTLLSNFPSSEASQPKRRKLAEAILKTLRTTQAPTSHSNALITRIIQDLPRYSKLQLSKLIDFCLNSLRVNDDELFAWREILPIALQILEEEKYINYRGNEVTGPEFKSLIIQSICNQPWEVGTLTSLAKMFGEIRMEKNDHGLVLRALCDKLPEVDHQEVPPLVHQILRMSDNVDGRLVIGVLQKYFTSLYERIDPESPETVESIAQLNLKEVQDTESTVLYHIRQSALLNHSSLKDFVKNLKNVTNAPEFILEPFPMSVLLLLSDIYTEQIFEIIKHALVRKIQDDERRRGSFWIKTILPDSLDVMEIMGRIIENSNKDRHLVLKGLLDLAFVLMETGKAKDGEENILHEIGVKILQKLVKKRHEVGPTVLQNLTDKIIAGGTAISHYVECLAYMCRKATLVVLDSQVWISTLQEQLLSIPGEAATQVLYATIPLIRASHTIRDSLVLILRKALYRKGVETRKMAVTGFLQFLSNLKIAPFSLSQSSSSTANSSSIFTQATLERGSQSSRANSRTNVAFCQEILIILTKCFSHECEVRQHLYKGLADAVCVNPELAEPTIDLLLEHFSDFYETDEEVKPPVRFDECSGIAGPEAVLQEPIGDLIFALQRIYCTVATKNLDSLDRLSNVLESLCKRMCSSALDALQIDDRIDILDNVPKSQQKVNSLKICASTLEALIAYRLNSWSPDSGNTAQNIFSLFKSYNEIIEFTKTLNKPGKGKKGDKSRKDADTTATTQKRGPKVGIKLPSTIIDVETIHKALAVLFNDSVSFASREQANFLKKRADFHIYCLQTCIQIFQNSKILRNVERQKHRESCEKIYLKIGEILHKNIICNLPAVQEFDEDVAILGLECFKEFCDVMCTVFTGELSKFLAEICEPSPSEGLSAQIITLIASLQKLVDGYYTEEVEEEGAKKKIPVILFETMTLLLNKTTITAGSYGALFGWLTGLAKMENIETNIALSILQLITNIEDRDSEYGKILDQLCIELCKNLGTIDDTEIEIRETFNILTDATMTQAHNIFNNSLKTKLNNASWILGRLKAEQIVANTPGIGDEKFRESLKDKERSLCRQLSYSIQTLQTLANANIEPGSNTDLTFKNLHHLYNIVNNLTKYFSAKSTPQNPAFQAVKFIQVVQLAGKPLKTAFYNLVTSTEEKQNSGRKTDAVALKNKVLKETKFIPKVIYEIEQFNKEILVLGKKSGVPLDSYVKHSITRDFRIKHPQLVEGLERLDPSQMLSMTQNTTRTSQHENTHLELPDDESSVASDSEDPPRKRPKREVSPSD